jgi:hypothetical protein
VGARKFTGVFLAALVFILVCVSGAGADTDLKVKVVDPNRPANQDDSKGNTITECLEVLSVPMGENRVLGTVRTTGKPDIKQPLRPGQQVRVILPEGVCYMRTPDAQNYRDYVEWPPSLDGKQNQIYDSEKSPGIQFISATPRSLTIELVNIDTSKEIMVFDFVFNKPGYSAVRISPIIEKVQSYQGDSESTVSRQEYFNMVMDVLLPFSEGIDKLDTSAPVKIQFTDVPDWPGFGPLVEAGYIAGYKEGTLKPDQAITRAEAACLLGRLFGDETRTPSPFKDALPQWAETGIISAAAQGIVTGYPDGTFQAQKALNKQEAILMLLNALETYSR